MRRVGEPAVTEERVWSAYEKVAVMRSMTLLAVLDPFYTEHRHCGDLDGAVEGNRVWMTCTCGAVLGRRADEEGPRERDERSA